MLCTLNTKFDFNIKLKRIFSWSVQNIILYSVLIKSFRSL